jgi:hypothetical protein
MYIAVLRAAVVRLRGSGETPQWQFNTIFDRKAEHKIILSELIRN